MASLREFIHSIGQDAPMVSIRALASQCGTTPPISVMALMQGQCRRTIDLRLQKTVPYEGNLYYTAQLNGQGTLEEIAVPPSTSIVEVRFVKVGYGSEDCNNSEAVVSVPSGTTIGKAKIGEIYNLSEPKLPLPFLACIATTTVTDPNFIIISVTYSPPSA
ncbi:MAG: hypothetical protein AAFW84_25240 [Cyanobacteria bacterium J06635_15]